MTRKITSYREINFVSTNGKSDIIILALQTSIKELVKSPVKQNYSSQAIFAASTPRT